MSHTPAQDFQHDPESDGPDHSPDEVEDDFEPLAETTRIKIK